MTLLAGERLWGSSPWGAGFSASAVMTLLLMSHLTLLSGRKKGSAIFVRLALLTVTVYFIADLAYNLRYSFGSGFRDLACGTLAWHLFAKAVDVGIIFDIEGTPPPRWCVPDWSAESKEEEKNGKTHKNGQVRLGDLSDRAAKGGLPFWRRTPIPSRPKWAVELDYLPTHWRLLPLPTRLVDRLIWSLDVLLMRRHGTSLLFPNDLRALEWSQRRLLRAGQAQKEHGRAALQQKKFADVIPFGYSETPVLDAVLQTIAVGIALDYFSKLDIPASTPGGFYDLPFSQQIFLTCSMGVLVSLTADLPELLVFPLLQGWPLYTPCTAIVPCYRNVVRSKSLTDMWGYRWHTLARRDFARLGLLFPFGASIPALMVLKSFFWSAVFHSCIFLRHQPQPSMEAPWKVLHSFYLPGCFGLFLGQGLLVIAENALRPFFVRHRYYSWIKARPIPSLILSCLQSVYVYATLIFMARWVLAEMFRFNLLSSEQTQTMRLRVQLADYADFLREQYSSTMLSIGMRR